jgi:hypothetical protein
VLLDKMCLLHHTADTNEKIAGNIAHGLVVGASAEILQRPSAAVVFADLIWALGATGKIVWPIPDKGLEKAHASYQSKKTLIVWGEEMTH